jgi:cellulose synthase/poly-beta-1,6-N-acetylglucosamine synthase-like glycosyltransferase
MAMAGERRVRHRELGTSAESAAILTPVPTLQQRPADVAPLPGQDQYNFLLRNGVNASALERANAEAGRCGVATHEALLASGALSPAAYASALAGHLGVALASWRTAFDLGTAEEADLDSVGLAASIGGRPFRVLCAEGATPDALRQRAAALKARGMEVALAPRFRIEAALEKRWRTERLDLAVRGLYRMRPVCSAGGTMIWTWQLVAAAIAVGLVIGGVSAWPEATIGVLAGVVALPFLCVTLMRGAALGEVARAAHAGRRGPRRRLPDLTEKELPVYSVLVPLFREANVVADLIRSLAALDYPRAKLEVLLILEAADIDTQAALLALQLPHGFRTIVVPDAQPRTKPKALNYALQFARGDYVVVYDAEDRPQPDQLRRALETFRSHPPDLGCVQAQLNIYNARASWFTRQFTVEYSALFDGILPALARFRLPVPLGGTSNHFPREVLLAAGGWDPFNVTEDADLGFRLARQGWRTTVLASTTWEEAPIRFGQWFRQRTRWLKGWMQTYLVHTRQLWKLSAELGVRGALGFHAIMGGIVLSALVHPLFYLLLAYHAASGELFAPADSFAGAALWTIAWVNLVAGYLMSIFVGALSAFRRGQPRLALSALLMPLCWLLVSAAAYRALWQLARDPYFWEKTEHGAGPASLPRGQ